MVGVFQELSVESWQSRRIAGFKTDSQCTILTSFLHASSFHLLDDPLNPSPSGSIPLQHSHSHFLPSHRTLLPFEDVAARELAGRLR
jgi:hypothetical protein